MYLVSSCLAGINCRYDAGNNVNEKVLNLVKQGKAVMVCPEQLGGLLAPRVCCEIVKNKNGDIKVMGKDGQDYTKEFMDGAEKTLLIAKISGSEKAILKSRSPSCGYGLIYDGTFSGKLTGGNGLTAELLGKNGIKIYSENEIDKI